MFYLAPFSQTLLHLSLILQLTFHFLYSFDELLKRLSSYPKENNFERLSHDTIDTLCTGLPRRNVAEMETPAKYYRASAIVNGHLSKLSLLVVSIYVAFA